jgi:deoxyribodipyrimidine photo-lyase
MDQEESFEVDGFDPLKYEKGLFIFRRDLRGMDNTALIKATKECKEVLAIFIFTPTQITNNKYKSDSCVQFMCESLVHLKKYVPVKYFYGEPINVLKEMLNHFKYEAIYVNSDYTPFSRKRDSLIEKWCGKQKIGFHSYEDIMLHPIFVDGKPILLNKTDKPYTTYTFYKNAARQFDVPFPEKLTKNNFYTHKIRDELAVENMAGFFKVNKNLHVRGGRKNALKILKDLTSFKEYAYTRDLPSMNTTNLSAYNKFGCVSIREVYHAILANYDDHPLIDQLIWRDFYYYLLWHFPHSQNGSFYSKFDKIEWDDDVSLFKKWKNGNTGFPLVDAGMRQMNTTGYMHNRVRMVCAQFLVKNLLINWKVGELYFASKLVDYDPAQNVGNWQWNASTGIDRFRFGVRIFNPFQSDKYDPEAIYIKKWVSELETVEPKHIHKWSSEMRERYEIKYPAPIVNHKEMAIEFKKRYMNLK